jgi:hypothetical protein
MELRRLRKGLRLFISDRFPEDIDAAGPGDPLGEPLS